jgi:hypothetical protein
VIPSIAENTVTDEFGNINAASTSTDNTVIYDVTVPVVSFSSLTPANPSSDLKPTILGTVSESSTMTLYYDSACSNAKSLSVVNTAFASPGLATNSNVNANSSTVIYGKAIDTANNPSACTSLVTYVHDSIGPAVTNVSSTAADGSYKAGEVIPVTVTFTENVFVTGNLQMTLETGVFDSVVSYSSGSGTNVLTFNYAISSGEVTPDLDYASAAALALISGAIRTPLEIMPYYIASARWFRKSWFQ